jgi:hypothetical protein
VRRELAGIVGLSLVAGLLVTSLLIGNPGPEVSLVSWEVPERFDRSVGSRPVFSLGIYVGRDFLELGLRFAILYEADPKPWVSKGKGWIEADDLGSRPTGVVPLDIWLETALSQGVEVDPQHTMVTVNGTEHDAYIYDFRDLAGDSGATDVLALLFSDGNLSRAYWGYGGFFLKPSEMLASLRIEHGRGSTVYSRSAAAGEHSLSELPARGEVSLAQVERDDQILVTIVLEGHLIPVEESWLWVCTAFHGSSGEETWAFSTM